ncbi:methionine adenosyltransferase [Candidatus Gracilibacteria bacterium]|nr:methionine adenosyltransferase [Candidatus Gracilibacteria bacterium]
MKTYITSESVSSGHPDKICDQISDAILDACLEQDPNSRVACETLVTTGTVIVSGEITTKAKVDYTSLVRKTICEIGYNETEAHYNGNDVGVHLLINTQSPDIAVGVDSGGAGDQGIMYGYATNETPTFMPAPIYYAHKLAKRLEIVRKENTLPYLLPDGKTQVTVEYIDGKPKRIDTVVISNQHRVNITQEELKSGIKKEVIDFVLGDLIDKETIIHINPTGIFQVGGPKGDCGLTGRKIIVDTYGGIGRHGGGAFSGKDPSKVDRSGAYIARYLSKNIVASGICDKCEVQLSYAIGVVKPVSIYVDFFATGKVDINSVIETIKTNFDLSQNGIIKFLDLRNPIYKKTASYGHFGRDDVSWEKLDSSELFKKLI